MLGPISTLKRSLNLRDFDIGLGTPLSFGRTEHQGSHKVWGTQLDEAGRYQVLDLQ